MRGDTNLLWIWVENGGNQKANFVCNNAERRHRKDHLSCRNVEIGLPLISLSPLHDGLLHGKFKTFNRLKRSKAGEITMEHYRFYVQGLDSLSPSSVPVELG